VFAPRRFSREEFSFRSREWFQVSWCASTRIDWARRHP